ncbi:MULTISPECIES: flagellar basal body rod protein FlgB [Asticcacaulis]|jgi:flagellar basal-body rod protein FlgB|uniref:Flagellar basal body rod protein FlgB n=1 Tax=Asticcacaulis endophyticus TaxID=1395890 RepID=A0A918Q6D3_9CAUL|nr:MULTISPECIES: flagellar basal body rod protein FlgB [Asticcacaulis]WAC48061.1 flagellar basal body rod protein FlgB [Asticcacaulis sp. SL142]WKL57542.1 flagellar basal body rod protein FlgB [Asticcacaulis sp. ZE23SCel15]GGZ33693.1 flagellar basal body rod protein FlgB [Asticcacaulis endophyticus]
MDLNKIGIFSALKTQMGWLGQRQKVVAQNVANASTPGFKPRDLRPQDFAAAMKGQASGELKMAATRAGHIAPAGGLANAAKAVVAPDSETTLDGNSVVVEEQMLKMAESRMQYDAAIGFYQKSLAMLRLASTRPR